MKNVLLWFFLFFVTLLLLYFIFPMTTLDEVWNYGFAYNISKGMVPYIDFSMVVPPLFPFLISIFINIFGNHMIIYHVVLSIIITVITYFSYKKIGYGALGVYILLLVYPSNGYNTFSLFLFFILLCLLDKEIKNKDIIIACIISLMCLSKQTMGLLIIPSIIYSSNRKKSICVYFVFALLLFVYLFINNNIYQFFDYCFLGMFDFTSKNNTGFNFYLVVEVIVLIKLIYDFVVSKFSDMHIIYILLFQILAFPIVDYSHFSLCFIPVIFYYLNKYKFNRNIYIYLILVCVCCGLVPKIIWNVSIMDSCSIYRNSDSYINYRMVPNHWDNYFSVLDNKLKNCSGYRVYILGTLAYLYKLELNLDIDKYDLINDGNMGYGGSLKYIKDLVISNINVNYCKNNKCVFVVDKEDIGENRNQTNQKIINFVMDNGFKDSVYNTIMVYYYGTIGVLD